MKAETSSKRMITALQKKWKRSQILALLLFVLALTTLLTVLSYRFFSLPWWGSVPLFTLQSMAVLTINRSWQVNEWDVSRFLNRSFPQLEESCELVLQPLHSLNFLQQLQRKKVEQTLSTLPHPNPVHSSLKFSAIILVISLALSFAIIKIPFQTQPTAWEQNTGQNKTTAQKAEEILPALAACSVKIIPPAYTGKAAREQDQPALKIEEGSRIHWQLSTNRKVKNVQLLFNEQDSLVLKAYNQEQTQWSARKIISQSGFYQVKVENKLSELYPIEVIPDQPPMIHITNLKPHTFIDVGTPQQVAVKVAFSDDYGMQQASILATLASGSGENVNFQEKQLAFDTPIKGKKHYSLQKNLDLSQLGMKPGGELYFYVKALDNHNQESRSDIYFITLPDTAELMSMESMTIGVNLMPEYFRSQRQIIMDTEKLMKEQDSITVQEFQNRSNNLGIDQKLLRLRYGKFLGEESETDAAGSHEHEESEEQEHAINEKEIQRLGDAQDVLHSFGHTHDNAEDATFFDPELKSQLKATLTEMWHSELQLRTFKPSAALPYAYKALRLLKDLQQKSRAYVGKTSVKTPPLKSERRLSGELEDIIEPVYQYDAKTDPQAPATLKKAIAVLESVRYHDPINQTDQQVLEEISKQLNEKAAGKPATYLKAANALRNLLASPRQTKSNDIYLVEQALQKMINQEVRLPQPSSVTPSHSLLQQYFENLNQLNP